MALPYTLDDEGGIGAIPAGAMRAMVRSIPASRTMQPIYQPHMQAPRMPVDAPMPNLPINNEWSNLGSYASGIAKDFGEKKENPFGKIDEALADLKKQRSEYAELMGRYGKSGMIVDDFGGRGGENDYNRDVRAIESSGNDSAVNAGSGATGRYQFLPTTAKSLIPDIDLATLKNPDVQEKLMRLYTDRSVKALTPVLGRKPSSAELYMAHLLGQQGATNVLTNLDAPLASTVDPAALKSNKTLLGGYATGRDFRTGLSQRFGG